MKERHTETRVLTLADLKPGDFGAFGLHQIAYVKPVNIMGKRGFALHGADGAPLAVEETEWAAARLAMDNNLEPVRTH